MATLSKRVLIQPIFVDDLAELAVQSGEKTDCKVIDAIGPETFTFRRLVKTLGEILGKKRLLLSMPPAVAYVMTALVGRIVGDVVLTREEVAGLMAGNLKVNSVPAGKTRLTEWARENAGELGRRYASELGRRRDRTRPYL